MKKQLQIRNSTAEFLIFAAENEADGIEVRFEEQTLWLTQSAIAELFHTTKQNVSLHIQNIFESSELSQSATVKSFLTVRQEGTRQVNRSLDYYNLDMIIAVGYREHNLQIQQANILKLSACSIRHFPEACVLGTRQVLGVNP